MILPDARVLFAAWRGVWGMYCVPLCGGKEEMLQFEKGAPNLQAWSVLPDGRWLAVSADRTLSDIGVIDLNASSHLVNWLANSRFTERRATFSLMGRDIAFEFDQLGRTDVWMMNFSDGRGLTPVPVSREGGLDPFWSRDGRTLYYTAGTKLMAADIEVAEPVRFGSPHGVLDLQSTHVFGIGPDGRFIAIKRERAPVTRLEIILNWADEIRQRIK